MTKATANKVNDKSDKIQHYCTPPWAARQLVATLNNQGIATSTQAAYDPCAGQGHMIHGLMQRPEFPMGYGTVYGDDIIDYSPRHYVPTGQDYIEARPAFTGHVVTNPPFHLFTEFATTALDGGAELVAMLVRAPAICGKDRARDLFEPRPPAFIMPFTVRPHMQEGAPPAAGGKSAMDSVWVVWLQPEHPLSGHSLGTRMVWLPRDRRLFTCSDDWFETYVPPAKPKKNKKSNAADQSVTFATRRRT